ncbi:outer membrane protein assembly factor BamB family protein [Cellulomonas edaphi]|uniref:PQQ-binding-like beta-propeller repeat protein n=1 Tax=Cellulomonas edaphi TaxID=3053468 RepID=A0ABT7S606_9CELL|nr:PQQ-binding-like beta-propeller repeat protein [Cellulomons edaphi]MDM7830482.1 PQQ-binding-like beta-propeller repeat protein [Cellulomons edaphi]
MSAPMRSVELVEADEPEAATPEPTRSWARRHAWWGAAVAVLLAVTLVALQARADAAERAHLRALALVPEVLHPVDDALDVAWRLDTRHAGAIWNGPADGVLVSGARVGAAFHLQGTDVETGRERWSTPVRPSPGPAAWTWCLPLGAGSTATFVCTAGSNSGLWDVTAPDPVLWVVQPATGRLLGQHEVPVTAQIAALGRHLLLVRALDENRWRLEAVDPVTWVPVWTFTTEPVPGLTTHLLNPPQLVTTADAVVLSVPGHAWSVDHAGRLRAVVPLSGATWWSALRAGVALGVTQPSDDRYGSVLLLPGGSRVDGTDGELRVSPDDGTAPDVFFTTEHTDGGSLVARSAVDGAVRWRADETPTAALLVDGRLVVATGDAVVAFDAETGEERWRRTLAGPATQISTDGRTVVVAHESPTVDALALHDGTPAWSTDVRTVVGDDVGSVGFYGSTRYLLVAMASGAMVALR